MTDQRPQARRQDQLDRRLGELDTRTAQLTSEQHAIRADIERLTGSMDRLTQQVGEWMRNSGRPNWGWFIGAVGLVLTVGSLALSPIIGNQAEIRFDVQRLEARDSEMLGTRWRRSDHDQYAATVRSELDTVELRLAEQIEKLGDKFEVHVSNGHPHTVLDKIATLEKLLNEVRADLYGPSR